MVGVDPGVYTALVILDLEGNVVAELVERDLGEKRAVEIILEHGKPVIIATDVCPPPFFVKKLASRFNAVLFYPKQSYSTQLKVKIGKHANPHLRDAFAAALKSLRKYENRFRSIDAHVKDRELRDRMKENIIKKRRRDEV